MQKKNKPKKSQRVILSILNTIEVVDIDNFTFTTTTLTIESLGKSSHGIFKTLCTFVIRPSKLELFTRPVSLINCHVDRSEQKSQPMALISNSSRNLL